jgi:hypothetical protein
MHKIKGDPYTLCESAARLLKPFSSWLSTYIEIELAESTRDGNTNINMSTSSTLRGSAPWIMGLFKTFDFPTNLNRWKKDTVTRTQPLLKQLPFVAHHGPHGRVSWWGRSTCWCWPMQPRMLSELHQARWARAAAGSESGGHDGRPWIHCPFPTCTGRIGVGRSTASIFPRIASHRRQVTCDCEHGWFISSFSDDIYFHGMESATRQ